MLYDEAPKRNEAPKSFFNPLNEAISVEVFNDDNSRQTFVLHPLETATYPTYLADLLIKHLVTAIANEREKFVTEEERAKIQALVEHIEPNG